MISSWVINYGRLGHLEGMKAAVGSDGRRGIFLGNCQNPWIAISGCLVSISPAKFSQVIKVLKILLL